MQVSVQKAVEDAISGQVFNDWRLYTILFVVFLIRIFYDKYFGAYVAAKAELKVVKEGFEDLKERLRQTTEISKSIETKISHDDWVLRENKMLRRAKLEELFIALREIEAWSEQEMNNALFSSSEASVKNPSDKVKILAALYFPELKGFFLEYWPILGEFKLSVLSARRALLPKRVACSTNTLDPVHVQAANAELMSEIDAQTALVAPCYTRLVEQHRAFVSLAAGMMGVLIKV